MDTVREQTLGEYGDYFWPGRVQALVYGHSPVVSKAMLEMLRALGVNAFFAGNVVTLKDAMEHWRIDVIITTTAENRELVEELWTQVGTMASSPPPIMLPLQALAWAAIGQGVERDL